jgi:Raf kinase inhibitor-like YbhB/YbcL family protein
MRVLFISAMVACALLISCRKADSAYDGRMSGSNANGGTQMTTLKLATLKVTSAAFRNGEAIPERYTGDDDDISPPLEWSGAPDGTQSFAVICDDPDAPKATPFVHWVIYNIPGDVTQLQQAFPFQRIESDNGTDQGKNDFGLIGYNGPRPPSGTHRYYFKVYALDTALTRRDQMTKPMLELDMQGHILAAGQLMGTYTKKND